MWWGLGGIAVKRSLDKWEKGFWHIGELRNLVLDKWKSVRTIWPISEINCYEELQYMDNWENHSSTCPSELSSLDKWENSILSKLSSAPSFPQRAFLKAFFSFTLLFLIPVMHHFFAWESRSKWKFMKCRIGNTVAISINSNYNYHANTTLKLKF